MSNFDKLIDRHNINSLKWNCKENELPMWVADMDFEVAEPIVKAIKKRINNKTFGYNLIPEEWHKSYVNWWKNEHNFNIKKDWVLFSLGVVPSISSIVRRLTRPGEKIILLTPVYNVFFNSVVNNGRFIEDTPLIYKDYKYSIDFDLLEEKMKNPLVKMMIFCNPHNPVGKIWSEDEIKKVVDLAYKYHVLIISDEIHCEITNPDKKYVPFLSVNNKAKEIGIMVCSPSKSFNIAGIHTSAIVIPNEKIRFDVYRGINNDEIAEPNTFAIQTSIAAFNKSKYWLDEMKEYVYQNRLIAKEYLEKNIKDLKLIEAEATYLLWIDISKISDDSLSFVKFLKEKTGLIVCEGEEYGEVSKSFIRVNIATQKERVLDGLSRLKKGVELFKHKQ